MDKLKREQRKYKLLGRKFPVEKKRDLENFMKSSPLSPADGKNNVSTGYDHFATPLIKQKVDQLTEEEKKMFKRMGENIYGKIDYQSVGTGGKMTGIYDPDEDVSNTHLESLAQIKSALSSGLHPSRLTEEETTVLVKCVGCLWYEILGYEQKDLTPL